MPLVGRHSGPLSTFGCTQRSTILPPARQPARTVSCFLLLSSQGGWRPKIMEGLHAYSMLFFHQEKYFRDFWHACGASCCYLTGGRGRADASAGRSGIDGPAFSAAESGS